MSNTNNSQEKQIFRGPEFNVKDWIDVKGNKTDQIKLVDFDGKFKVINYC